MPKTNGCDCDYCDDCLTQQISLDTEVCPVCGEYPESCICYEHCAFCNTALLPDSFSPFCFNCEQEN